MCVVCAPTCTLTHCGFIRHCSDAGRSGRNSENAEDGLDVVCMSEVMRNINILKRIKNDYGP
jgi:hypothetical protein